MQFIPTALADAYVIEPDRLEDERGFFARTWCQQEFTQHGLDANLVQCNLSFNKKKGTLRGIHLQLPPFAETKLVRCTQGAIYDVIVDLRPHSTTYLKWTAVKLTAENRQTLYVPKGFGHGFQTLADNTEVIYHMSEFYHPDAARGIRWDDPVFNINWTQPVSVISDRDRTYPDYLPDDFPMT